MLEGTLNKLRLVGNALHEGFIQRFSKGWPCRGLLRGGVVLADCNDCSLRGYDL
jgi:hypothetical protein